MSWSSFPLSAYADRQTLLDALASAFSAATEDARRWRLQSLLRCLRALEARTAPADRAVLLRQAAWLSDNKIDLPKAGWDLQLDALEPSLLARFGLRLSSEEKSWHASLLDEDSPSEMWPQGLQASMGLETRPRRTTDMASPDGALCRLSPYTAYRTPTQKAAARAILTMAPGAALMVSMSTGAGKSLLFQLGALWWREQDPEHPACVVVIVPTVSLALDHAESFKLIPGLERCRALTSDAGAEEKRQILLDFIRGDIPILVMNPETAFRSARETLERACQPRAERLGDARAELAAFIIDEAHIIESWGRSFRPDFQLLSEFVQRLRGTNPGLRTVLLSATLGDEARSMLRDEYGKGEEWLEIHAGVPRYELDLFAQRYDSEEERERVLFELIDRLPRPAIVYTTTQEDARSLRARLKERHYSAVEDFTGGTVSSERKRILERWRGNEIDLVIATSAFGMGIDKPDVRAVLHACLPEDAARHYQEVGRAGRDGHRAVGVCLFTEKDVGLAISTRTKEWLGIEKSVERWCRLAEVCTTNQPSSFTPTGRRQLSVHLDIAPERLGSHTGEHNREWNRTLMNLMRRAGVLRVIDVDEGSDSWTIEIIEPRILDSDRDFLAKIFDFRNEERSLSREAFEEFLSTIEGDLCLLAETFQQIEAECPQIFDCGRCGPCQKGERSAPDYSSFGGLRASWKRPLLHAPAKPLPGALLVEHKASDLTTSLREQLPKLVRLGYAQFLVPDERAPEVAALLANATLVDGKRPPGLVMGFQERAIHSWQTYDLPTAAIIDPSAEEVYQQAFLRAYLGLAREQRHPLIVLAPHEYRLDGRALVQCVDTTYPLSILDSSDAAWRSAGDHR